MHNRKNTDEDAHRPRRQFELFYVTNESLTWATRIATRAFNMISPSKQMISKQLARKTVKKFTSSGGFIVSDGDWQSLIA
jgi:hypothetical protein